jgi:hypothetical protein
MCDFLKDTGPAPETTPPHRQTIAFLISPNLGVSINEGECSQTYSTYMEIRTCCANPILDRILRSVCSTAKKAGELDAQLVGLQRLYSTFAHFVFLKVEENPHALADLKHHEIKLVGNIFHQSIARLDSQNSLNKLVGSWDRLEFFKGIKTQDLKIGALTPHGISDCGIITETEEGRETQQTSVVLNTFSQNSRRVYHAVARKEDTK